MRLRLAATIVAIAAMLWFGSTPKPPIPGPSPAPLEIDLSSAFQGETAADDAAALAAMADELANVIEWDGKQTAPALTTGKSLDLMRTRTREFLMKGESLGERHPKMRQIVADYLQTKLGSSGGAISPEQRASWVSAYREVARASRSAIKK